MTARSVRHLAVAVGVVAVAACGSSSGGAGDADGATTDVGADRCIVRLHGKGGSGAEPAVVDGIAVLAPDGNGSGWGGRQWEYDSPGAIRAARDRITAVVDTAGCTKVVVHGFSNGGSMAAALYCSGDDLDGRLVGVVVDDPVTDGATEGCTPAVAEIALYWTGALAEAAPPGTECASIDWTCAGELVRGIDSYAADLDVEPLASPFDEHRWYLDSPLPVSWLG